MTKILSKQIKMVEDAWRASRRPYSFVDDYDNAKEQDAASKAAIASRTKSEANAAYRKYAKELIRMLKKV